MIFKFFSKKIIVTYWKTRFQFDINGRHSERRSVYVATTPASSTTTPTVWTNSMLSAFFFFLFFTSTTNTRSHALEVTRRFDLSAWVTSYSLSTKDRPSICRSIFFDVWPSFSTLGKILLSFLAVFPSLPHPGSRGNDLGLIDRITYDKIEFLRSWYTDRKKNSKRIKNYFYSL